MKRLIPILILITLSGCSSLGDLEVLNGTKLEGVREAAATINRMDGRRNTSVVNTGAINRKYGEIKGLDNRDYDVHDIPHLLQSLRYIFE